MKLKPGETPKQLTKRIWQSLKDKNLINDQGKLTLPEQVEETEVTFMPTYKSKNK